MPTVCALSLSLFRPPSAAMASANKIAMNGVSLNGVSPNGATIGNASRPQSRQLCR